jgi:isopropylmalate/homocitrate/citramalate synthase
MVWYSLKKMQTASNVFFASELRTDADKFSKEMEAVIFCSEAAQERLVIAKADYLKAAETEGSSQLFELREKVSCLAQESAERFQHMLCVVRRHNEFLLGVANAVEGLAK